jgi:hypothetical protein
MINGIKQLRRILSRIMGMVPGAGWPLLLVSLFAAAPVGLQAQDEADQGAGDGLLSEEITASLERLPEYRHLAASLADPDTRFDTLFTMVVVARVLENVNSIESGRLQLVMDQFADDRAWLDRLASHYLEIPMRSTVLDPSSWLIALELEEHGLQAQSLVSPLGPDMSAMLDQLFDRSEERLAATLLPEVLLRMESESVSLWRSLRESSVANEALLALVAGLSTDWFEPWTAAEPPAPLAGQEDVLADARDLLAVVADAATLPAPPDELALKRIRFSLLMAEAGETPEWDIEAAYVMRLAAGIESLHHHDYLSFVESLLWVVSDIFHRVTSLDAPVSPMAAMLAELLPRISNMFAREFAEVDPRINAGLAAAYDVVHNLQGGKPELARERELSLELADAVAQVVLMVPDMDYYFGQPVRDRIAQEIDICISVAAARTRVGDNTLTREQFDRCLGAMVELADRQARSAELSGDPDGPFASELLARELALPPWQRINYVLGYMHDRFSVMCTLPSEPLPNPQEWATLATLMAWFAERAPVYFQTPANEALVMRMRQIGIDLLHELSRQADCFSGAGGGVNDPVSRSLQDYDGSMLDLVHGIREAELAFRSEHLMAAADVVLGGDSSQRTSYRSEGMLITACDAERTCGVTDKLEATRALVGLFPDPYLIADQTGLGQIEICYDNIQWVNRRSEPVRQDDPFVANYFGHLSFELKGRYSENDRIVDVFGARFVSPDEYHYLFAGVEQEVLEDSCPLERVGQRIHASLDSSRDFKIVPDRLTYLSSARVRPSQVISSNWGQGAEWRDWFVTGIGVTALQSDGDPRIGERVNQHLQSLFQAQQAVVYAALLPPDGTTPEGLDLSGLTRAVSNDKAVIRSIVSLFYPSQLLDSDRIRAALEGQGGLLDETVLARLRDANVAVSSIGERGTVRLEDFRANWGRLPDNVRREGSVDNSVAHALTRLNAVYRDFFGFQPETSQPRGPRL